MIEMKFIQGCVIVIEALVVGFILGGVVGVVCLYRRMKRGERGGKKSGSR